MDLFEDLQARFGCQYISDLPILWRSHQKSFAFVVLTLKPGDYDITQWIDLCNYIQVQFDEAELSDVNKVRALFKRYT